MQRTQQTIAASLKAGGMSGDPEALRMLEGMGQADAAMVEPIARWEKLAGMA